ncbi:hypothetical protein [Streptomyces sp. cmx-4-7]|uniref:hypothetical protein n=1 Tax=Streptomyces sp. cmx-4-7 TaxID=2790939 RepID=UPI00397F947C
MAAGRSPDEHLMAATRHRAAACGAMSEHPARGTTEPVGALARYDNALAREWVAAGVSFFNGADQVLPVDAVHKK